MYYVCFKESILYTESTRTCSKTLLRTVQKCILCLQVYERKSWTGVYMSRAQNARCPRSQTALSYEMPGTGLALDLTESERLCKYTF